MSRLEMKPEPALLVRPLFDQYTVIMPLHPSLEKLSDHLIESNIIMRFCVTSLINIHLLYGKTINTAVGHGTCKFEMYTKQDLFCTEIQVIELIH